MPDNRILIIGLDGASFRFIRPLLQAGKLPNIQKIVENGVQGKLKSTMPPVCASAWASFLTGQNPGKHGVFDFFEFKKNAYKKKVIDIKSIKSPVLWQLLEKYDKKMIFMNIPIMFPPQRLNGVMVAGALTPPGKKCAFPESLSRELYRKNYIVDIAYDYIPNLDLFRRYVQQMTTTRYKTFRHLLEKYPWDLSVVNFVGLERLKQAAWDKTDLINELYIEYDRIIGKLIQFVGKDVLVMIISGHGFTSVEKKFFVNEWLSDLGLLTKEIKVGEPSIPEFIKMQFGKWREEPLPMRDFLLKGGFNSDKVRAFLPTSLEMLLKKFAPLKLKQALPHEHLIIDWRNTQAYLSSRFSYAININLKGREPGGIVAPEDYEEIRNHIIRELHRLKDPHTFKNIIQEVFKGEQLYWGPYAAGAPDIVFVPENFSYSIEADKRTEKSVISDSKDYAPVLSATHPDGIFLASGSEFAAGKMIQGLKIWDIAPIIFHLLNIPIPNDMDGVVPKEIFKTRSEYASREVEHDAYNNDYLEDWETESTSYPKNWEVWT